MENVCFNQKTLFIFRFLLSWSHWALLDPKVVFLWKSQDETKEMICHQLIKSFTPYWNITISYVHQFSGTCFIYSQYLVDVWKIARLKYLDLNIISEWLIINANVSQAHINCNFVIKTVWEWEKWNMTIYLILFFIMYKKSGWNHYFLQIIKYWIVFDSKVDSIYYIANSFR